MKVLFAIVFILMCGPLSAALVTNGTLDSGCAGWVFSSADGGTCRSAGGNPDSYAVLNNSPGPVPQMTQTIAGLAVGDVYQLTWDMISAYQCCSSSTTPGAGAAIDGNLWEFIVPNSQNSWQSYSQTFTYTGGSSDLTFTSQRNQTDTDVGIDNVALTDLGPANGVPEPSTLLLVAPAIGALAWLRRRN